MSDTGNPDTVDTYVSHVCCHESGTGDLRGKRLTYQAVKDLVLKAGRFSVFEATASARHAAIFTSLSRDPELTFKTVGFPWTEVARVGAKESA